MRYYLSNPESYCPVQTRSYGGLPGSGWFKSNTMYEVGAAQIGEAAHCLLGSWWKEVNDFEPNHLLEEFLIIEDVILNYGRHLVSGMGGFKHPWREYLWGVGGVNSRTDATRDASIASMNRAAERLEQLSERLLQQVELPYQAQQELAEATYSLIYTFSVALQASLKNYPGPIANVYLESTPLHLRLRVLRGCIETWLTEFHLQLNLSLRAFQHFSEREFQRLRNSFGGSYTLPSGNSVAAKVARFYRPKLFLN